MLLAVGFLQLIWTCDASLDKPGIRERHPVCYVSNEVPYEASKGTTPKSEPMPPPVKPHKEPI